MGAIVTIALFIAGAIIQKHQQEKAIAAAEKQQERQLAAQAQAEEEAATQWRQLTEQQIGLEYRRSQIESLTNLLLARDQPSAEVIELPAPAKEYSWLDRVNMRIDAALRA